MRSRVLLPVLSGIALLFLGYYFSAALILLTHSVTGAKIAALSLSEYAAFRLLVATLQPAAGLDVAGDVPATGL